MNKEFNAGTEVDNGIKPIVIPSASLAQSPMLAAVLNPRNFFRALGIIAFLLISAGYFLWIYNNIGFHLTTKCFLVWGFCLASYTVSSYLIVMCLTDMDV